ncbi:MAG: M24 family metallopeptidase [Roseibium sp.]|nr:M24 family metallopeptidase [Roseibium sp.]
MAAKRQPFSADEFQRRLKLVRRQMDVKGIDVLFVEDPSNMAWISGYDGWSFYVHQGLVIPADADPIWWGRQQDAAGARRTVWLPDDRIRPYGEHYIQTVERHPMQDLAHLLEDMGYAGKRIGVELENYYFTAKAYLTLQEELPNATFEDATGLVNWQRAVKSDAELSLMRKAARITDKVMRGVFERAVPGLRKTDLVAEIYADAIRGVGDAWGDYPAIVPLLPSGGDASAPHLTWDGRCLEKGEATFFEVSGCVRRYHAPLCRTVFLGAPPKHFLEAEKALLEGLEAGLDAGRAGNTASDIFRALVKSLNKAGIGRTARCGYPVGLSYPPDWGERTISLRADDTTVLKPGMTFHFMPGLWMDDWGLEITETILIKDAGPAECLCDVPRDILIKP